VKGSASELISI